MSKDKKQSKKQQELEQRVGELTQDLQRTRADFENYRKRSDSEKQLAGQIGEEKAIMKLLPVIDTIHVALSQPPKDLSDDPWVKGIIGIDKKLETIMSDLKLEKISIVAGETEFDPELHEAISSSGDGEKEVIGEELQAGYRYGDRVIRHAMVRVENK